MSHDGQIKQKDIGDNPNKGFFDYYKDNSPIDHNNDSNNKNEQYSYSDSESDSGSDSDDLPDFELIAPSRKKIQEREETEESTQETSNKNENRENIDLDLSEHIEINSSETDRKKPNYKAHSTFASFLNSNPLASSIKTMMMKMNFDVNNPTGLGKHGDGIINPLIVNLNKETGVASVKHDSDKKTWEFSDSEDDEEFTKRQKLKKEMLKDQLEMEKPWKPKPWRKHSEDTNDNIFLPSSEKITKSSRNQDTISEKKSISPIEKPIVRFPDIHYRLSLVIDKCEININSIDKRISGELQKQNLWRSSQDKIQSQLQAMEDKIKRTKIIINTVDETVEKIQRLNKNLSFETAFEIVSVIFETFSLLHYKYNDEYFQLKLNDILINICYPLLKTIFKDLNPFNINSTQKDKFRIKILENLKNLFRKDNQYESIIEELIVTKILEKFSAWSPLEYIEEATTFMKVWIEILPDSISSKLLKKLILPKIEKFVTSWNPLVNAVHPVVLPWVPLLNKSFEKNIYILIIDKLVNLLSQWIPSDHTAHTIIFPWRLVMKPQNMQILLSKGIFPQLQKHLSQLHLRYENQDYSPMKDILLWKDIIPASVLLKFLDTEFFSKWLKRIYEIVTVEKKKENFDKIQNWINKWKDIFPENMQNDPFIQQQFKSAQHMLNEFKSGGKITPFHLISSNRKTIPNSNQKISAEQFVPHRLSFKELIQRYCNTKGISFRPLPNNEFQGHQIYKFGAVECFIKAECLWIQINGEWDPVSLKTITDFSTRNSQYSK